MHGLHILAIAQFLETGGTLHWFQPCLVHHPNAILQRLTPSCKPCVFKAYDPSLELSACVVQARFSSQGYRLEIILAELHRISSENI